MISDKHTAKNPKRAISLIMWTLAALLVPNVGFAMLDWQNILLRLAYVVLPAGAYTLLLTISRHIGRSVLWMWLFMVLGAIQTVLLFIYGAEPIGVDMYLSAMMSNTQEASELLGNLLSAMIVIFLIYVPVIAIAIVAVVQKWRTSQDALKKIRPIGLSLTVAGLGTMFGGMALDTSFNPIHSLFPLNSVVNIGKAINRYNDTYNFTKTNADFDFHASSTRADTLADDFSETYVLVLGETSRADNWHILGYDRATSDYIDTIPGIVAYGKAFSQANTTHKSVPMLLTHLNAHNYGDSIFSVKSLITAFKQSGYRTYFLSTQGRNHAMIDDMAAESDSVVFVRDSRPDAMDGDLLPLLDKALSSANPKKLIVMHTNGSHFNYSDRYPKDFARFKPFYTYNASPDNRPTLVNSYDNSILYTSYVLSQIISRLKASPGISAMLYTSDHGEDIFDDDRRLILHSSPSPTFMQLHVPMFIWMSDRYASLFPDAVSAARANTDKVVWTSDAVFNTLIDLSGIDTPYLRRSASVLSDGYTPAKAAFVNDFNEGVDLRHCGLKEEDFILFNPYGLAIEDQ